MDELATQQLIEAIAKLGDGIEAIAKQRYTLTGAADWPLLVMLVGVIGVLVALMWTDIRAMIKDNRGEWRADLQKEADQLWNELRRCQEHCKK